MQRRKPIAQINRYIALHQRFSSSHDAHRISQRSHPYPIHEYVGYFPHVPNPLHQAGGQQIQFIFLNQRRCRHWKVRRVFVLLVVQLPHQPSETPSTMCNGNDRLVLSQSNMSHMLSKTTQILLGFAHIKSLQQTRKDSTCLLGRQWVELFNQKLFKVRYRLKEWKEVFVDCWKEK
jgi:hypothetical protein